MTTENIECRNSMEQYQAKCIVQEGDICDAIKNISIKDEKQQHYQQQQQQQSNSSRNNRRRAVNSHLYTKNNKGHHNKNVEQKQTSHWTNDEKLKYQNTEESPKQQNYNNKSNPNSWNTKGIPQKKNTESFKPSHKPTDMRLLFCPPGCARYPRTIQTRDMLVVNDLFCKPDDLSIYNKLISETETCGVEALDLWKLWHGDSHMIADDKLKWKRECPTFNMVLDKIRDFFQMDIKGKFC